MRKTQEMRAPSRVVLFAVLVAACAAVSSGLALAQDEDPPAEELQAVHDQFCGHPSPCRVINTLADPAQDDADAKTPPPLYQSLRDHGRPASDCPEAAAAYAAAGEVVDAFIGPCPVIEGSVPGSGGR